MKKKLISLLLVLVLVIGVTVIGVAAEEATSATHSDHCICGGNGDGRGDHVCAESGVITGWQPFSVDVCEAMTDGRLIIPTGNYYLAEDLKTDKAFVIAPDTEVTICLNGKTLESSSRVFRVHGILNISECTNGTGKVIGTNGGNAPVFYIGAQGHINHYRGILRASQDTKNYGGVGAIGNDPTTGLVDTRASGSMTMYGGTLDASKVTLVKNSDGDQGFGGALVIFGNTAAPCSFTQYGGTIKGAKSVASNGAAIHAPSTATVQILGGTVESGTAKSLGDGIYAAKGCTMTVGGSANIEDLYVTGGQTFTTQNLTGSVGLSAHVTNAAVLTTAATADEAAKFTSNVAARGVVVTEAEGVYQISLKGHVAHCDCGGNLTGVAAENHTCAETTPEWTALTAENIVRDAGITVASDRETDSAYNMFAQSGHYYLSESIELDKNFEIRPGQNITVCLNGYTLTTSHSQTIFRVTGGTLNICDCTGTGTVKSTWTGNSPLVFLLNSYADATEGVTFNLYGGNLKATDTGYSQNAGAIQISNNAVTTPAVMNMYGGTVSGGHGKSGGNITMLNSTAATLNMYGGTIKDGQAAVYTNSEGKTSGGPGGNIYCTAGKVYLYGGTITSGETTTYGGNVYLSGTGTFEMQGGSILSGTATSSGGNIYLAGTTTFEMRGGSILSGTTSSRGGNVFLSNKAAVFNMYAGTIDGGTAKDRGGNVYVNAGAFNMYGGTVINGQLTEPDYGADLGKGAPDTATDSAIVLDGKVRVGEVGVYGTSDSSTYAIYVGENFSTEEVIKVNASGVNKRVLTSVEPEEYQWFAAANEGEQVTYEDKGIHVRSADDHYACYCGGTYITGGEVISHVCNMYKWTPVTNEMISSGTTTTETQEVTDADGNPVLDADGNPTTEEVTVVTGWGSPVNYDNSVLGGTFYHLPAGSYYLTEDITLEHGLRIVKDTEVRIDLNGHKLIAPEGNARAFFVQGNLRICDSSYDASKENKAEQFQGAVIGMNTDNYNIAYISGGGVIRIFGGNYYSAAEGKTSQCRIAMVGKLYIFDGYFKGGDAAGNGKLFELHDNGSHTAHGSVAFYRATAEGGNAVNGGIINLSYAGQSFSVESGTLIGGTASGNGGAIYASAGTVRINGGQIMNGKAKQGGNIYAGSDAVLTISGGTISGGETTAEGGNIYTSGLTMTDGTVSGGTSASYGGSMYIFGTATISGGTVKNGVSTSTTRSGGNICVTGGELTVSGETVISGGQANEGGNLSCRGGGTINIEGGTIENGQANNHGGNIAAFNTLNISGGVIRGGKAVNRGGNISTYGNTGKITITGGQIADGILLGDGETAAADLYGANISMLSVVNKPLTLTITGGTIGGFGEGCVEGVTSVHVQSSGDEITTTVGGTAVIDELRLGTGRMLTIAEGGFSEGASIGITRFEITGVFAPNAAADYSAYFHGTKEGTSVEAVATETGYDLVLVSAIPYWAFDAKNNPVGPAKTIADAMALEGATFVRLVSDYTTDEVVEGDLHLDLYGYDLTGLTVNGNLYAVDYKGHDYEEGVLGKLIGFTGTVKNVYTSDTAVHNGVRTYVALTNEDGSYSFHRVSVSISHVSLKADADALGFKATVKGDAQVLAAITGFGFNMGVEGGTVRTYTKTGAPADGVFTLRLKGIMAANGGEMSVIGQPVIYFGEDSVTGSQYQTSMKETIEAVETAVEKDANAYTEAQITTVQKLIAAYEGSMSGWNIDAIKAWAPATEDETTAA